ncbi:hypothetical protein GIY23_11880 [Allosaccharopolyspora coralli]|uniref:XshC-Cox1 family protein n=1 Tax=Allosaccharopolyspora coralli TaxID=2665642 RepID=A0A5Q3Q6N6_9PSEU|nr:XdhC/CoxI family protein [Allosaccharopolyspora coralli]QGK70132.1 hypothetical protein GIY23_11880 [Allosaccharopolyspora coralli]
MHDIAATLREWARDGHEYALATVVSTVGSAPRGVGSSMAVRGDSVVAGSLTGGCVEAAVHDTALDVLRTGTPRRERFGYSDGDGLAVGLTCGGEIDVFVQPVPVDDAAVGTVLTALSEQRPVALASVTDGGRVAPGRRYAVDAATREPDDDLTATIVSEAAGMLELGRSGVRTVCASEDAREIEMFVQTWARAPRMLVFGATDFARALSDLGTFLGYRVTVCDARKTFTSRARFPAADEVVVDWPHRYLAQAETDARTVVCVLTHEAKFDVPVLVEALRRDLGFVGAMGSRRTHRDRLRRLREAGVSEDEIARLRSPIGLDLGGRTPEETALSFAAEITARRRGGSGAPLTESHGALHHEAHGAQRGERHSRPTRRGERAVRSV